MTSLTRFGRRLALPSTRQIRHELIMIMQEEARVKDLRKEVAQSSVPVSGGVEASLPPT